MSENRTSKHQTSLAYLLLATILTSLWFLVLLPVVGAYTQTNDEISALQARNQSLSRQLLPEQADLAANRKNELNTFIELSSFTANTPEIGGSFLQKRLVEIIENNSANPKSTLVTTNTKEMSIAVSVQLDTTLKQLGDILVELAQSRPFILINLLSIRTPDRYLQATDSDTMSVLAVQIDVSAFLNTN